MSANFKCYNTKGQLTFDLQSHTSRLLKVFGYDINETTHTFNDDEMGGGTLFWYTANPIGIGVMIEGNTLYNELSVNILGNQISFKKHRDITLFVGVKV